MYGILQSLPARLLKTMIERRAELLGELIDPDNPIIDIVLVKKRIEGFMGALGANIQAEEYNGRRYNGSGIISFMTKRFTITANESYNSFFCDEKTIYDSIAYTTNPSYYASDRFKNEKTNTITNNININYLSKSDHNISLNFNNNNKYNRPSTIQYNRNMSGYESISDQKSADDNQYYSGNIRFQSKYTEKGSTILSYSLIHYNNEVNNLYNNNYIDTTINITQKQSYGGNQHHGSWTTTFKNTKNNLIVNIGTTVNFAKTDYKLLQQGKNQIITNYEELYITPNINFTFWFNKKNLLTTSLKQEYSSYKLAELTAEQANNSSWRFMPEISWRFMPKTKYVSLLYFKQYTERPSFFRLSPRREYILDKHYIAGNPSLKPKNIYFVTWRQTWNQKIVFNISIQKHKNEMVEMLIPENDIFTQTYRNALDLNALILDLKLPFAFLKKKLNITFTGNLMFYKVDKLFDDYVPYHDNCRNGRGQLDITYEPNYRWYFSGTYSTTIRAIEYFSDVSSTKYSYFYGQYLCSKKHNIRATLMVLDPFNLSSLNYTRYSNNTIFYNRYEPISRGVQVGLSWSFKGGKDFNRKAKASDANRNLNRFRE